MLAFIIYTSDNYKQLFTRTYLAFFIFDLIAISWLPLSGMRENADRFLILGGSVAIILHCITLQIPVLFFYFFYRRFAKINKRYSVLLFLFYPFFQVGFEYLTTIQEVSFPWLNAGHAFTNILSKIQFADITGVFGVSLWAVFIGILLFYLCLAIFTDEVSQKKSIPLALLILIVFVLPDIYNYSSSAKSKYSLNPSTDTLKAGIVQPNINPWGKWTSSPRDIMREYIQQMKELIDSSGKPDLLILPETAMPYYLLYPSYEERLNEIKNFVDSINVPVLTGFVNLHTYLNSSEARNDSKKFSNGTYYDVFNSALLIEKNKLQIYNKIKLVIASERMPYQEKIPFLRNMINWSVGLSSFQTGKDTTVFSLDDKFKFNTAICYESIYPEFFSSFVKRGSQLGIIITNDGWWGKLPGTYQHNQFAIFRAIENRRWILRTANTGISCSIDPYGDMYLESNINQKENIIAKFGTRTEMTFYTLHGDYIGSYSLYLMIFLVLIAFILKIFFSSRKV